MSLDIAQRSVSYNWSHHTDTSYIDVKTLNVCWNPRYKWCPIARDSTVTGSTWIRVDVKSRAVGHRLRPELHQNSRVLCLYIRRLRTITNVSWFVSSGVVTELDFTKPNYHTDMYFSDTNSQFKARWDTYSGSSSKKKHTASARDGLWSTTTRWTEIAGVQVVHHRLS